MASVVLENVSKRHLSGGGGRTVEALRGVTLTANAGELLVLLGPSGAGKSTLLRLVAGLDEPSSGKLFIGNRDMDGVPPEDRSVSMVFQEPALYPHMTVRENLGFGLKLRKIGRAEAAKRVEEAAAVLGLQSLLERRPSALSGGERQRVSLGRALVLRPALLLLDEPFSQLDAPLRAQLRQELITLQRELRITMIYVTHDQLEAMSMADRLVIMKDGGILQWGVPADLYRHPASVFVASFLGLPAINLIPGTLLREPHALSFRAATGFTLRLPAAFGSELPDAPVLLGVRPEHLAFGAHDPTSAGSPALPVEVLRVESLGWETHVWLDVAGQKLVARAPANCANRAGDRVMLTLDLNLAHLFDSQSGRRLC